MKIKDLILDQTLDCGQCFRWNKDDEGHWIGVVNGKVYALEEGGEIPAELYEYFDLDTDYGAFKKELASRDSVLAAAIEEGTGIRILKQDLWETLISFIVSQNNNIPRIKGCIEKLCELFGEPCTEAYGLELGESGNPDQPEPKTYYSFPTVERLAALELSDLAPVRLGYRAPYILKTAKAIYEEGTIRDDLSTYKGVGPKVEACIKLFGRHDIDAFPIDVWVKRVMNSLYQIPESNVKEMARYAEEHFKPYGGIAQQYLFYAIRKDKENE